MIIQNDSIEKIKKFLDRCTSLTGYSISFYVFDSVSTTILLNEIQQYYKTEKSLEIETVSDKGVIEITFKNKSTIRIL